MRLSIGFEIGSAFLLYYKISRKQMFQIFLKESTPATFIQFLR